MTGHVCAIKEGNKITLSLCDSNPQINVPFRNNVVTS